MLVFSGRDSNVTLSPFVVGVFLFIWVAVTVHRDMLIASIKGMPFQDISAASREYLLIACAKTNVKIICAKIVQLISTFVFCN